MSCSISPASAGRSWAAGWLRLALLFWMVFATACAKRAYESPPPPPPPMDYGYAEMDDMAPAAAMAESRSSRSRPSPKRKSAAAAPPMASPAPVGAPPPDAPAEAVPAATTRKIHYAGFARLRVASVEESTDQLTVLAKELGGLVESVAGPVVTLRVPVEGFEASFDAVTELGDLLDRSITARDVTEAFTAVDLRLSTARRTRDRLVELLAKAEDEREKLALIEEIQRVSEEIDRLESQLRTLDSLASFSRITVQLVPRQAQAWRNRGDDTAEMAWIRDLSPFRPDLVSHGKRLSLPVPEGMVQLTPKRRFIAEGPEGSRIWSGRLPNDPAGDGAFWVDAIQTRVGPEFATAEVETVGGFTLLQLTDRGDTPYTWWIAVRPRGKWLDVVEVYFPTPAEQTRFEALVRAALEAAGGAA